MEALIDPKDDEIAVNGDVLRAAASRQIPDSMVFLLDHHSPAILTTDKHLKVTAESGNIHTMGVMLDPRSNETAISRVS